MRTAKRGVRELIRNPLRAALLIGVLGVSIGLTLIMITVNGAFAQRLDQVRAQVGTDVTVRPAGTFGGRFFDNGGGAPTATPAPDGTVPATTDPMITDADLQKLVSLPHVVSITRVVTARYDGTNLVSGITAGGGATGATPRPGRGGGNGGGRASRILITGTDDPNTLGTVGVQDVTLTAGRTFTSADAGADVAVIGQSLATANNLAVGSTFALDASTSATDQGAAGAGVTATPAATTPAAGTAATVSGATFTVIGVYTTGTQFGDNSIAMPIDTARAIFARGDQVDQAIVKADSVDTADQVATDVKNTLGTDTADVTTAQSLFTSISSPLSDAKSSSQLAMIVALVASAAIILFAIGLVARQRVREIGILKAIGASNWDVVGQFSIETGVVAISAAILGAIATFPLAQSVANGLVSSPSTGAGGAAGRGGGRFFAAASGTTGSGLLGSVNVAVSPQVFLYALGIAMALALIAAIVPAWYVGRVKPAEVLRNE